MHEIESYITKHNTSVELSNDWVVRLMTMTARVIDIIVYECKVASKFADEYLQTLNRKLDWCDGLTVTVHPKIKINAGNMDDSVVHIQIKVLGYIDNALEPILIFSKTESYNKRVGAISYNMVDGPAAILCAMEISDELKKRGYHDHYEKPKYRLGYNNHR